MADIAKVKANVGKMVSQGAPESDIDSYLASENVTPEQLRSAPAAVVDPYREDARTKLAKEKELGIPSSGGATRLLAQGATFGFGDEILAALGTPLEMIDRKTFNPAEAYKFAKAKQDLILEDSRKNAGALGTAAEIGGGVFSGAGIGSLAGRYFPQATGLAARMGVSALDGLGFGALAGAGEGNGLSERLGNAATGGLLGGVVGGAAPAVIAAGSAALSPVIGNVRARVNPQGYAQSQVARAVTESGMTPADIAASVGRAANEGQGMFTVADAMGNPGQRMLSTVTRSPGPGRTAAVDFLDSRQAGQGRRVAGALAEGFDSPRTAAQAEAALTSARDRASDIAYGAARNNAGPVDLSRAIANIDATLQPGVNRIVTPQSNIANDSIESALQGFRSRLTDGRSVMTDFTATQRFRGDLSDAIEAARRAGNGNRARLLGGLLREVDTAMENASPGFRAANAQHAAGSRAIEAVGEGRTAALRGRTEDTIPAFRAMPAPQQGAFRTGYVDPLIEQAQGGAFGVNKARPLTSDAFREEAAAMAPGNALMQSRLGRENTMFETRNAAMGGSKTADNLADEGAMGVDVGLIGQVISGNMGGALRSAMSAVSNGWNGNTAGVREEIARILLQRGQNVNSQAIQRLLDETVQRMELVSALARQLGRGASAGVAVAPSAAGHR